MSLSTLFISLKKANGVGLVIITLVSFARINIWNVYLYFLVRH